jgi:hypothetical protein
MLPSDHSLHIFSAVTAAVFFLSLNNNDALCPQRDCWLNVLWAGRNRRSSQDSQTFCRKLREKRLQCVGVQLAERSAQLVLPMHFINETRGGERVSIRSKHTL